MSYSEPLSSVYLLTLKYVSVKHWVDIDGIFRDLEQNCPARNIKTVEIERSDLINIPLDPQDNSVSLINNDVDHTSIPSPIKTSIICNNSTSHTVDVIPINVEIQKDNSNQKDNCCSNTISNVGNDQEADSMYGVLNNKYNINTNSYNTNDNECVNIANIQNERLVAIRKWRLDLRNGTI